MRSLWNDRSVAPDTLWRVGTFRWPVVHGLPRWTWSMDYLNGLPWMDHPEICGKHKLNDSRTRTKDAINWQTKLRNTCDVRDLTIRTKDTIDQNSCDLILKRFLPERLDLCYKILDSREFSFVTYMIRDAIHITPYTHIPPSCMSTAGQMSVASRRSSHPRVAHGRSQYEKHARW